MACRLSRGYGQNDWPLNLTELGRRIGRISQRRRVLELAWNAALLAKRRDALLKPSRSLVVNGGEVEVSVKPGAAQGTQSTAR